MNSESKIRLVRCPKCRKVLPEMPDIPVYQCGGCGTTLLAKIRKQNAKNTTSSLPQTNAEETNNSYCVSEGKGSSSSSHETDLHSAGECSLDQNNGKDQIESGSCNGDNLTGKHIPSEDENSVSDQNGSQDKFGAEKREDNLSNDGQKIESDSSEAGLCDKEQVMRVNLSSEDCNNGSSHQIESLTCNIEQRGISNEDCSSNGLAHVENGELSQSLLVGSNLEVEDIDEASSFAAKVKAEAEADANNKIDSTLERSNQGELVDGKESNSIVTAYWSVGESISSDILTSSPNELLEQPQETADYAFDRARSTDTFDTTDFVIPSSELSGSLIDLSKSPTTRSSRAYYDDGVSSYEGTDDQLANRHKQASKHAHRVANHAVSDVRSRRERFHVNNNYEMQQHFKNSASIPLERTHYPLKYSTFDRGELLESTRLGHPGRNWRNLEGDEYLSQYSFHTRESMFGYGSGSTCNQLPNELYYNSNFPSLDERAHIDQQKLKLLRMVYELQDQLKASLNDKANGGFTWKDHQIPMYYNHQVEPEENFHGLVYPRHSGRARDESNWSQHSKYSPIPFSAEATINRHQVDHSLCCCPQDRKRSAQLPPSDLCHSKGFCRVHSRINLYNSYGSCSSSPQQHVDSKFPMYSRGTKSDDQRHRDSELRKYLREKHHLPKRHLRPLAGGAPFITCPCCLKLLQLPADFLLFKRRCQQLKCGACSEVLKFSLVNSSHLIPCMPLAEAPPPSEVDEYSDAIHRRNFTSTSHITDCPSASCSDDCGQYFFKSCSTGRDPVAQGNAIERNMSYDSLEHDKERKWFFLNENQRKGKNPVETNESAGPSAITSKSKIMSSEIEELPTAAGRGGGSPFHRLMGYSSAREVLYGCEPSKWPTVEQLR